MKIIKKVILKRLNDRIQRDKRRQVKEYNLDGNTTNNLMKNKIK